MEHESSAACLGGRATPIHICGNCRSLDYGINNVSEMQTQKVSTYVEAIHGLGFRYTGNISRCARVVGLRNIRKPSLGLQSPLISQLVPRNTEITKIVEQSGSLAYRRVPSSGSGYSLDKSQPLTTYEFPSGERPTIILGESQPEHS